MGTRTLAMLVSTIALALSACSDIYGSQTPPERHVFRDAEPGLAVSAASLIGAPDRFDSRPVSMVGMLSVDETSAVLYVDEWSYRYEVTKNGVHLYLSEDELRLLRRMNGGAVSLSGTVLARDRGPSQLYACSLAEIASVREVRRRPIFR